MEACHLLTLVALLCRLNVNSAETPTGSNVSEIDFDLFRARFHRVYDVSTEEFDSRHNYFQVREKVTEGKGVREINLNLFLATFQRASKTDVTADHAHAHS